MILCHMLWWGVHIPGQPGLFDVDERYGALSAAGDPRERLTAVVDFELFRPELDAALARSDRGKGGRPLYDAVLMFKVLVLQALYTLSDDQTEYQLKDRLSFMRFCGLALEDFMGTEIEVLVAGDCVLQKERQDPAKKLDYKDAFELD